MMAGLIKKGITSLTGLKNGNKAFDVATTLLDQSVLTTQEKADKTLEYQERTGSTPSAISRRWVTKFMIIFIASFAVITVGLFRFDPEWGKFAGEQLKVFCSNWVITTIVVFFYGGYYVQKGLKEKQKAKIDQQSKEHEVKMQEKKNDIDIKHQKKEARLENKRERRKYRRDRNK